MNQMNKWQVKSTKCDESGEPFWVVVHYVGGEEPYYVDDYYPDESDANARCNELNASEITYQWQTAADGSDNLIINGL